MSDGKASAEFALGKEGLLSPGEVRLSAVTAGSAA